jgi:hypothetical protein
MALYSLWIRIDGYGVTVERVYAMVVALTAFAYSVGYTVAALKRGPWMQSIERVNVLVAIGLILTIALLLTSIASPYRLAASSQMHRVAALSNDEERESALRYLRFDAGRYGIRQLETLVATKSDPRAVKLGEKASLVLELENKWARVAKIVESDALQSIQVFPAGREIEPALRTAIRSALQTHRLHLDLACNPQSSILLVDVNDDSVEEGIFLAQNGFGVFSHPSGGWILSGWSTQGCRDPGGRCASPTDVPVCVDPAKLRASLAAGDYRVIDPKWRDLRIGAITFRINMAIDRDD